jgi:hypothetical protein
MNDIIDIILCLLTLNRSISKQTVFVHIPRSIFVINLYCKNNFGRYWAHTSVNGTQHFNRVVMKRRPPVSVIIKFFFNFKLICILVWYNFYNLFYWYLIQTTDLNYIKFLHIFYVVKKMSILILCFWFLKRFLTIFIDIQHRILNLFQALDQLQVHH